MSTLLNSTALNKIAVVTAEGRWQGMCGLVTKVRTLDHGRTFLYTLQFDSDKKVSLPLCDITFLDLAEKIRQNTYAYDSKDMTEYGNNRIDNHLQV